MSNSKIAALVKEAFPEIDWLSFEDCDRALNWELWYGPLPSDYWTHVEPLDHYEWKGYIQAEKDIREILEPLPDVMWFDVDFRETITLSNPDDFDQYWEFPCKYCGEILHTDPLAMPSQQVWVDDTDGDCCSGNDELENENEQHVPDFNCPIWVGGEWMEFHPREVLMFTETWKQVY